MASISIRSQARMGHIIIFFIYYIFQSGGMRAPLEWHHFIIHNTKKCICVSFKEWKMIVKLLWPNSIPKKAHALNFQLVLKINIFFVVSRRIVFKVRLGN